MHRLINASARRKWLIGVILAAALLTGCSRITNETKSGTGSGQKTSADGLQPDDRPATATVDITIENFAYVPADITVAPGTRVTWTNKDDAPHTATSTEDKFRSEALDTGDKYSHVFEEKGDFAYFCALHPQMKARIRVQ
jgi:plastocyanin